MKKHSILLLCTFFLVSSSSMYSSQKYPNQLPSNKKKSNIVVIDSTGTFPTTYLSNVNEFPALTPITKTTKKTASSGVVGTIEGPKSTSSALASFLALATQQPTQQVLVLPSVAEHTDVQPVITPPSRPLSPKKTNVECSVPVSSASTPTLLSQALENISPEALDAQPVKELIPAALEMATTSEDAVQKELKKKAVKSKQTIEFVSLPQDSGWGLWSTAPHTSLIQKAKDLKPNQQFKLYEGKVEIAEVQNQANAATKTIAAIPDREQALAATYNFIDETQNKMGMPKTARHSLRETLKKHGEAIRTEDTDEYAKDRKVLKASIANLLTTFNKKYQDKFAISKKINSYIKKTYHMTPKMTRVNRKDLNISDNEEDIFVPTSASLSKGSVQLLPKTRLFKFKANKLVKRQAHKLEDAGLVKMLQAKTSSEQK